MGTDPTKGQTRKSTKWTDLTKVELTNPQSGRIPPRVKLISPQSGRTQPRPNLYKSNRDQVYVKKKKKKKRGRTLQTFKAPIHIMDGPNQFIKLYKSIMWTAIRGHDHIPRNERTRPGSQKLWRSTTWTNQIKQVLKHQDGSYTTIINATIKEAFK